MRSFFLFLLFLNGGRHIFLVGFLIKIFLFILSFFELLLAPQENTSFDGLGNNGDDAGRVFFESYQESPCGGGWSSEKSWKNIVHSVSRGDKLKNITTLKE